MFAEPVIKYSWLLKTLFLPLNVTMADRQLSSFRAISVVITQCGVANIQPRFIEDANDLITFFQKHNLQGCLPRSTTTFWPLNDPGKSISIDQTVTYRLDLLIKCCLYYEI